MRKKVLVIGTGAGGATAAYELSKDFDVTVLEAGKEFRPFGFDIDKLAGFRKTGIYLDERMITALLPSMKIDKTKDMVLVKGIGTGGTTTLATGNAVRYDKDLKAIGIDLDQEFEELNAELPITTEHQKRWTKTTKDMFELFKEMDLDPVVTPKLLYPEKCIGCGHCAIGCPHGAKWDTRKLLDKAVKNSAKLITGCTVTDLTVVSGIVTEVHARRRGKKEVFTADMIVLAAGGLGTPVILERSGIECEKTLFVDPVLCVAGHMPGIRQDRQILMPFISQQDGYIISPYMDYLSYFFHRKWRFPMKDIVSIMIKLADEEKGSISGRKIDKKLTQKDMKGMDEAIGLCTDIVQRLGVDPREQFFGVLNAGHPGGMLPLSENEKDTLHDPRLPKNLYVADATVLPLSMGNPPILTIMALTKKISERIRREMI